MRFGNLFSDRQRATERRGRPQVFIYDVLPQEFRGKVAYILEDSIGFWEDAWEAIRYHVFMNKGIRSFDTRYTARAICVNYILDPNTDTYSVIDMIETAFSLLDNDIFRKMSDYSRSARKINIGPDAAIEELNSIFLFHDLGYQFTGGQIVRIDSEYTHAEVVEPAITLLYEDGFEGALDEFMRAHRHYRRGELEDAILDANNAFESTIKTICARSGIQLAGNEKPEVLIQRVLGIVIPKHLGSSLNGLRSIMQALPTLRSNTAGVGHGQGPEAKRVMDHAAGYAIHMAAANIVFLVESYRELKKAEPPE